MFLLHARKNDHLEFFQNSSIARKLKKHKIAVILGYKETHFRANTHKPAPLLGQWKNPHKIPTTLRENP
jgi:hypothetical protein